MPPLSSNLQADQTLVLKWQSGQCGPRTAVWSRDDGFCDVTVRPGAADDEEVPCEVCFTSVFTG